MSQIQDGTGNGNWVKVDANKQMHTRAINITATQSSTNKGNSYNINTGNIPLTTSTESGVFYFKNDEAPINGESSFIVDAIAVGIDNAGTTASMANITIVANPTGGTLISGESEVSMNQNRNLGSSNTLSATTLTYKGSEGNTITGGDDWGVFYQNAGSRGFYTVDMEVPKGSSFAVKVDTQTSSGTTNLYVAMIGHRVDGNNK